MHFVANLTSFVFITLGKKVLVIKVLPEPFHVNHKYKLGPFDLPDQFVVPSFNFNSNFVIPHILHLPKIPRDGKMGGPGRSNNGSNGFGLKQNLIVWVKEGGG